jgi:hypothetical protein
MFEEGSDMENLILKVSDGETVGDIYEYTIDAIKYVDGSVIKDVQMEGDRTVRVVVFDENNCATTTVQSQAVSFDRITLDVTATDPQGLIALSEGKIRAVVYDGANNVVSEQDINSTGYTQVTLGGLKDGVQYRYEIVADYDRLSGAEFAAHILMTDTFTTQKVVEFKDVDADFDSVSFALEWNPDYESKTLQSLVLKKDGQIDRELNVSDTTVSGLLSDNKYVIEATYVNGEHMRKITYNFKTDKKRVPTVAIPTFRTSNTSIGFDISVVDEDNAGAITKIELLHGNEAPVLATDLNARVFEGLLSNNGYVVRVTYTYDLNDGKGEQTIVTMSMARTVAKPAPVVKIENVVSHEYSMEFDLSFVDTMSLGGVTSVEFYHGDTLVSTFDTLGNVLADMLKPNENYTIVVNYYYDVNDGRGTVHDSISHTQKTLSVVKIQGVTYQLYDDKTAEIIAVDKSIANPVFECEKGYTITKLGDEVFRENGKIKNIVLPSTLKTIGDYSFYDCYNLESVSIPEGVESIGGYAFRECKKLKSIDLPSTLKSMGEYAFADSGLINIAIPGGVSALGDKCFYNCDSLESVSLAEGVVSIGDHAFSHCSQFKSIVLPSTLRSIGKNAFTSCTMQSMLVLPDGLESIEDYAFSNCHIPYIFVPENVKSIGLKSFAGATVGFASPKPPESGDETYGAKCATWNVKEICTQDGFAFVLKNDVTAAVLGVIGEHPTAIPSTVNGYTVTEIVQIALIDLEVEVPYIVIPKTITYIGKEAFKSVSGIEELRRNYTIRYEGTMAEWENIYLERNWNGNESYPNVRYVRCSDGTIEL